MNSIAATNSLRVTLRVGAAVFAFSAALLAISPSLFLQLLGLEQTTALNWSMRMIAVTLIALTGNMFVVSRAASEYGIKQAALVMLVSAFGLGLLTLAIPAELNLFTLGYAGIGFGFAATYATLLLLARRSR
jgi:hypothetical protein